MNKQVWHTKAGEDAWRHRAQRKRSEQLNPKKQQSITDTKPIIHRRASSRASLTSSINYSHRQSLTANPKVRLNRSFSRASFLSTSNPAQDNLRLLRSMHQGTSENVVEPIKNGIHVEFKLSTQTDKKAELNDQKSKIQFFIYFIV